MPYPFSSAFKSTTFSFSIAHLVSVSFSTLALLIFSSSYVSVTTLREDLRVSFSTLALLVFSSLDVSVTTLRDELRVDETGADPLMSPKGFLFGLEVSSRSGETLSSAIRGFRSLVSVYLLLHVSGLASTHF
jgi:hypothetical protein